MASGGWFSLWRGGREQAAPLQVREIFGLVSYDEELAIVLRIDFPIGTDRERRVGRVHSGVEHLSGRSGVKSAVSLRSSS